MVKNNLRWISSLLGNVRDSYVAIFVHGCLAYPKFGSSGRPGWGHFLFETRSFETGRHGGRASCLNNCDTMLLLNSNTHVLVRSLIILLPSFKYFLQWQQTFMHHYVLINNFGIFRYFFYYGKKYIF
jgi:hypothetical protein